MNILATIFTNGETCQFPYQINGWDMYYCHPNESLSVFTCPTRSNEYEVCVNGKKHIEDVLSQRNYFFIFKVLTDIL